MYGAGGTSIGVYRDISLTVVLVFSVVVRHFSTTCAVHIEDCGGWCWCVGQSGTSIVYRDIFSYAK